jgi:hypothetical protein
LEYFYTLDVTRLKTYEIACSPQDKNLVRGLGEEASFRQTAAAKPSQVIFKTKRFCIAFYESYPSMERRYRIRNRFKNEE